MNDIGPPSEVIQSLRSDLDNLIAKKDLIEDKINSFQNVVAVEGGIDGPLVDIEGYPRNDIDVYKIRNARNSINRLQNDHKAMMAEIEAKLVSLHQLRRAGPSTPDGGDARLDNLHIGPLKPFLEVTAITTGSPSEASGLQVGDKLCKFGSATADNFRSMNDIATLLRHCLGKQVRIVAERNGAVVNLSLVPRVWAGQGLLGCLIVPLK